MLLGLSGAAGSGKDTVADYLVATHGFKRYAFADAVRDAALAIDPLIDCYRLTTIIADIGWDRAKREKPEVRRLLQRLGTEVGRQILGENCWVDIVYRKWNADGFPNAVVTDLRFANEENFVREETGYVIQIVRPNNPDAIPATHASEQFVPTPDFVLSNEGTINELHDKALAMYHYLSLDLKYEATESS